MKKILFLVLVAVLFLTGCVEYGITIKVNKDGSGKIVENMLLSNQIMNMAKAMNPNGDGVKAFSKEKQMEKAPHFGEGVVFSEFEEISTESKQGYQVVYNFSDINKVQLSEEMFSETVESMTDDMQMGMGDDDEDEIDEDDDDIEIDKFFNFEYSKKGKLVIKNGFSEAIREAKKQREADSASKEVEEDQDEISDQDIQQQLAMARMFVQGMKFYTKIEFEKIKDANVPYENNQITLFEIDMDKLMNDQEAFTKMIKNGEEEFSKIFDNEKQIDGITFQNLDKITVDFK
jgi:hypothetical protein